MFGVWLWWGLSHQALQELGQEVVEDRDGHIGVKEYKLASKGMYEVEEGLEESESKFKSVSFVGEDAKRKMNDMYQCRVDKQQGALADKTITATVPQKFCSLSQLSTSAGSTRPSGPPSAMSLSSDDNRSVCPSSLGTTVPGDPKLIPQHLPWARRRMEHVAPDNVETAVPRGT